MSLKDSLRFHLDMAAITWKYLVEENINASLQYTIEDGIFISISKNDINSNEIEALEEDLKPRGYPVIDHGLTWEILFYT